MKMKFKVVYDDGRVVETTAKAVDIMQFERRYQTSFLAFGDANAPAPPLEHMWFMAWASLHRKGEDVRDFEPFMADVDSIESVEDEPPPVPTKRGRSAKSSPASQ